MPPIGGTTGSGRGRSLVIGLLLTALTLGVHAQEVGFGFVAYDDDRYVTQNDVVRHGLSAEGVRWAFTSEHCGNWHPVTGISHMLDVTLFGLEPAGHHAVNVALHLANVLLLSALLRRLTGAPWRSFWVAALFAIHPLHVESVAWIAERKDVLSTAFGLLATWVWTSWTRRGGSARYLLALFLFALGLMAKPMLVTLPFVFLLLDWWPLGRFRGTRIARLALEKLPFFALSAAACAATLAVQAVYAGVRAPLALRAANAAVSYARYLGKTLWPAELSVLYPHPGQEGALPWAAWQVGLALLLLAVCTAAALASRRRYLAVGWLWFVGTLVPVIGLVQVGSQAMADRYTYLPLVGLFVALVWGTADLVEPVAAEIPVLRAVAAGAGALALGAVGARAWTQVRVWRDSVALFESSLRAEPRAAILHVNLGNVLKAERRSEEALAHFRTALEISPGYANAYYNLAVMLHEQGRLEEAVDLYRRALDRDERCTDARHNLATALRQLGRSDEALAQYDRWLALDPRSADAHHGRGATLVAAGEGERGLAEFRLALEIDPEHAAAHNDLGAVLQARGRFDAAIEHFRLAVRRDPASAKARHNLCFALEALAERQIATGRADLAAATCREALAEAPADRAAALREHLARCERELAHVPR